MRKWIVRFVTLLVFNIVVLLLIGFLTPARVGWAALWAGIVMTALVLWVKPLIHRWFQSMAAKSAGQRTRAGEAVVQFLLVLAIAFIVWILTVVFSRVSVGGGVFGLFFGYIVPPVIIAIGWAVYAAIDDRVEARAGALYDRATGNRATEGSSTAPAVPSASGAAGRRELKDGLTDEQRRMLDELG